MPALLTREEYLSKIPELRLIDDMLARAFFDDLECAEVFLRAILDKPGLKIVGHIVSSQTQKLIHNIGGREVILDVLAEDENGVRYNIEVQRDDSGATLRRARLHLSLLDARALDRGEDPDSLPETYIVFLTEHDAYKKGVTVWEAPRIFCWPDECGNETHHGRADDGSHIVFANAECAARDTSRAAGVMRDTLRANPEEMETPELRKRMAYLKTSQEGNEKMCKVMEELNAMAIKKLTRQNVQRMLKMGASKEFIIQVLQITEEEFEEYATPLAS